MTLKKNFFFTIVLLLCLNTYNTFAQHSHNDPVRQEETEEDLDNFVFDNEEEIITRADLTAQDIANFAFGNDIPFIPSPESILIQGLYYKSHPLRRRSILDSELWHHHFLPHTQGLNVTPFAEFTTKSHFWGNDSTIKDYVNLRQGNIPEKIQSFINDFGNLLDPNLADIDVPETLDLFAVMKIQEKQFGAMVRYVYHYTDTWTIDAKIPLLWQIYHFYVTPQEEEAIKSSAFVKLLGKGDYMPFAKEHLISDKIGLGDAQINFEYTLKDKPTSGTIVGLSVGVPTAVAFKKGVYGSYFDKKAAGLKFNFITDVLDVLEAENYDALKSTGVNLGLSILDRLSCMLLEKPLGRDSHWTLGAYYKSRIDFTPELQLLGWTGIIVPLPCDEDRFILRPVTYDQVRDLKGMQHYTVDEARAALNRYSELLMQKLYPSLYKCSVLPGWILMTNTSLNYIYGAWKFTVGSNMWYQAEEKIRSVKVDESLKKSLDVANAINQYGYQTKTYVRIGYTTESNWNFILGAGTAGLSDKIGESTTFCFHAERSF